MAGVLTYTRMLLRRKDIADDIRSDLNVIAESMERVRKIAKGLLDFSHQTLNPSTSTGWRQRHILINALDATKPGDTITVRTTTAVSTIDVGLMGVEIVIMDTGSGIPSENLNKLI